MNWFTVPLLPPSVNRYKSPKRGGGYYRGAEAVAFCEAVAIFGRDAKIEHKESDFYEIDLVFRIQKKNFLRGDIDNLEKVAFDALTRAGIIRDDRYIVAHSNRKVMVQARDEEGTHYVIKIL